MKLSLEGTDVELVLSKLTSVKTQIQMIHLDRLKDGTWRMVYNENLIPDLSEVKSFKIIWDK